MACRRDAELSDPLMRYEIQMLHHTELPDVHFKQATFSNQGMKDFDSSSSIQQFDVITSFTWQYMYAHNREALREQNALFLKYLKPGGWIVRQEMGYVPDDDPTTIEYFPLWLKKLWPYRTIVQQPSTSDKLFEVFLFDSGRPKNMVLGKDIGRLAMEPMLRRHITGA